MKVVKQMMNREGFGRKRSPTNFKVPSQYSPGGTEENQDSQYPGRDTLLRCLACTVKILRNIYV